jgi:hypothetical protein
VDGERECFYWAPPSGNGSKPSGALSDNDFRNAGFNSLFLVKQLPTGSNSSPQQLNPQNFNIDLLKFYVRPNRDPYAIPSVKIQPSVTLIIQFTVTLGTGEKVTIPYQTTISTNNYDIPSQ